MNTAGIPVMQPVPPPQLVPNGSTTAVQQSLQYVMPTVDATTNHIPQNTFRNISNRSLTNPTMQFAPGEVNIDQPVPGNYTIQRFSQPQTSASFTTGSQVGGYPAAPPNYSNPAYNVGPYNPNMFQLSNQYIPLVPRYCPSSSIFYSNTQSPFLQQGVVFNSVATVQQPSTMPAPNRQKRLLKIVDPQTHEVKTTEDLVSSRSDAVQSGRRSASSMDTPPRDAISQQQQQQQQQQQHSNASQALLRQVANSVFNSPSPSSAPQPGVVEELISDQPPQPAQPLQSTQPTPSVQQQQKEQQNQQEPVQPVQVNKQGDVSDANVEITGFRKSDLSEAQATENAEERVLEVEVNEVNSDDNVTTEKNTIESSVDMTGVIKDTIATTNADDNEKPVKPDELVKEDIGTQLEVEASTELLTNDTTHQTPVVFEDPGAEVAADHPDRMVTMNAAEAIEKESGSEKKIPPPAGEISEIVEEKESEEASKERKRKEFEAKRQELLNEKEPIVDMANKRYGRRYMYLMREIIKEFALGTSCPVDISELKNLGIDMASAPAAVPSGYGSGRRCDFSLKNSFTPTWVENKPQKPKPYYGRGSDRSGHGIRGDQKRKSSVRLPNIDRPPREPVKLHKAEHAWRPEIGKKDGEDEKKKLYKQIRGLLNKITPSTFDSLSEEFLRYKCYQNKENMNEIINIIFDKAVEEPKFCPLYSDLCKKQVVEELKESKISEFRSGILTRCQQTFEKNKCQSEIDKKKKEAEAEQDEKKKKELKVEVMELEAKERRRMFGNIGFIGQLYRHELIVPKILKWCIIHLLKNHSETPGGDEESIECAVRMLETVGKIVDHQQQNSDFQQSSDVDWNAYFLHLKELSSLVSNRIRFLILNLIELRENKWNPRKSTDSGPMTIAAVHDEARKEEMQAKLAREQYDKTRKPYDGRPSLDRRRAGLVGRQSQDNRFYGKGDQSRDLKNRSAGQTTHSTAASSRKNQTLSTVDQPGKLGYRKGAFNLGSSGGSGQDGRKSSVASFRGAGRGLVTSRENSEPSSREPSESRKHSVAGDRLDRNLIATQTLSRPHMPTSASASCLSANLEGSRSATHSDEDDRLHSNTLSEEQERKMLSTFSVDLHEYFDNPERQGSELFEALEDVVSKSSVTTAFRLLMRVGVEKIGSKEEEKMHRQYLGRALCLFLQHVKRKGEALQGITDFCNYAVSIDLWQEIPRLWEWVAEIISWSIMCDTKDVEGERPSLRDFKDAFLAAEKDTRKKHDLLVSTLYRLAEIEQSREGNTSSTAMAFEELKSLDSPSLREALRAKMFHSDVSLYDALLN